LLCADKFFIPQFSIICSLTYIIINIASDVLFVPVVHYCSCIVLWCSQYCCQCPLWSVLSFIFHHQCVFVLPQSTLYQCQVRLVLRYSLFHCPLSFGHYMVCLSTNGLWVVLRYLQTVLTNLTLYICLYWTLFYIEKQ
jgi:hypothetical protein